MKAERLKWLAEAQPGECSLDEVRKMASELLSCRPYRQMMLKALQDCLSDAIEPMEDEERRKSPLGNFVRRTIAAATGESVTRDDSKCECGQNWYTCVCSHDDD